MNVEICQNTYNFILHLLFTNIAFFIAHFCKIDNFLWYFSKKKFEIVILLFGYGKHNVPWNWENIPWNFCFNLIVWTRMQGCKIVYMNSSVSLIKKQLKRRKIYQIFENVMKISRQNSSLKFKVWIWIYVNVLKTSSINYERFSNANLSHRAERPSKFQSFGKISS